MCCTNDVMLLREPIDFEDENIKLLLYGLSNFSQALCCRVYLDRNRV